MTATATRLLDNYIAGRWTPARAPPPMCSTSPTRPPARRWRASRCRAPPTSTHAVGAAREALPEWRAVSTIARARKLFELRERLSRARSEDLARSVTTEMGKTLADARAEVARMIEMVEAACAIPTTMQGRVLEDVARNIDAETIRQPVGVCAAIVPFNFPAMVPFWFLPVRDRLRQHVRAQALRAGAAHPADRLRGARRTRPAPRRGQPGQRRSRGGGGHPRPSGNRRGLVRRLRSRGADGLRARGQGRQARPGARRRQEPHGRHARRGHRQDRRGDHRLGLRRGRAALHGRFGGRHGRRRARTADAAADRGDPGAARRRRAGREPRSAR